MSKIAELLKLAEQKKDYNSQVEHLRSSINEQDITPTVIPVGVSKGKSGGVRVSKSKYGETRASRGKQLTSIELREKPKIVEISPTKDFTKVSNSITRQAIPEKYFRGLSKHTYDVLYRLTRGAVVPRRTVQLTKDELVLMTGLSKDAIKLHIKYLKSSGLVQSRIVIGSHAGWEYEIFVPEEIDDTEQNRVRVSKRNEGENLLLHRGENLPTITHTNVSENKELNSSAKTLFKDKIENDDELRVNAAMWQMTKKLDVAAKKITGKGVTKNEAEKWASLADLLILELEKAAKNTNSISSVPAFLTEVLRRQFFASNQAKPKSSKNAAKGSGRMKTDQIGKPDEESFAIKPLDEQGREEALAQLQDFAEDDFLESFKKWYTEDDWRWLTEKLKENNRKVIENL